MTTQKSKKKWTHKLATLIITTAAMGLGLIKAHASTNPAYLNINVTVSAPLSVEIDGLAMSTQTVAWSSVSTNTVSTDSATVTNNSSGITERWELSTNANSTDTVTSAAGWTMQTATTSSMGLDQFALQAVFGSSNTVNGVGGTVNGCPAKYATDWNGNYAKPITTTPVFYGSVVTSTSAFSDTNLTYNGTDNPDCTSGSGSGCTADGDMFVNDFRALCWRLLGPSSVSSTDGQIVQIVVTADLP